MKTIDINCDLGESFGAYQIGNDALIMPYISSANIACGYHAGDPVVMEKTVSLAMKHGVAIGAHPGYPDLQGFGRRSMKMTPEEIRSMIVFQVAALKGITESLGGKLVHVKPHGALYNDAAENETIARAIVRAILQVDPDLKLVGLAGSVMLEVASEIQVPFLSEVFADRAYLPAGQLVPRSQQGAVIHDWETSNRRVLQMINEGTVEAISGETIFIQADTVCIHGDNPSAPEMAKNLFSFLQNNGVNVRSKK